MAKKATEKPVELWNIRVTTYLDTKLLINLKPIFQQE